MRWASATSWGASSSVSPSAAPCHGAWCRRAQGATARWVWAALPPSVGLDWGQGAQRAVQGSLLTSCSPSPQVAGVISSLVILVTIVKIGELFRDLPKVHLVPQPPCHVPPLCPSHGKVVWQGKSQGPPPRPALRILTAAGTSLLGHLGCHHHRQPQGHVQAVR